MPSPRPASGRSPRCGAARRSSRTRATYESRSAGRHVAVHARRRRRAPPREPGARSDDRRLRSSPLMLFRTSVGPSPGAKARVNASTTAAGFLRSALTKSNEKRKVKPSGRPSSDCEREQARAAARRARGRRGRGCRPRARSPRRTYVARDPDLVEKPRGGAVLRAEDVRLPEPDADRVAVRKEVGPDVCRELGEHVRVQADDVRVVRARRRRAPGRDGAAVGSASCGTRSPIAGHRHGTARRRVSARPRRARTRSRGSPRG